MAVLYNNLWKLFVQKKIGIVDICKVDSGSWNTMTRLKRDNPVMIECLTNITCCK